MRYNSMATQRGRGMRRAALASASLFGLVISAPASAQDDQAQVAEAENDGLIVVTAQRRSELSRDVPITITTADAAQLQTANIDSLIGLPKLAPGLRFDQQGAYTQPTIRGIGTTLVQTGAGSSVGVYVDGFYQPNPLSLDFQFLNVRSVQVLKGPQGTLFGRNTTGGAILVNTADPSEEMSAIVEGSYARFNAHKLQAYFTDAVTDGVAFAIEGQYSAGDGFHDDNLYDGSLTTGSGFAPNIRTRNPGKFERWSIRPAMKVELSDSASLLFRYTFTDINDPVGVLNGTYAVDGQVFSAGDTIPGTLFALRRGQVAGNARTYFRFKSDAYQLTGNFDLGGVDLTSYTQYRKESIAQYLDSDTSSAAVLALSLPEVDEIASQEFLLSSQPGGPLQYTAGLFLFHQKVDADVRLAVGGPSFFQFSATGAKTRTYAAFADVTYELVDRLFLTGGLRYSRDEVRDPYYQTTPGVPGVFTYQSDRKDDKLSPRVVLRYKPSEESSVYASFTKGHKAAIPDFRQTSCIGNPTDCGDYLKPEEIEAFEIGAKYSNSVLTAELAAFYYDYKNMQVGFYQIGETILSNAASSRIKGIEGSLQLRMGGGFDVTAAATYLDAKYKDYPVAGYFAPTFIPDNDGDGRPEFAGFDTSSTVDASGNSVVRAPKFSGNITARYTTDLARGELVASTNLYYTSKIYFDAANQFPQKGYELLSARLQWTDPDDRYTVAVFGDNITDRKYLTQNSVGTVAAGTIWGHPATYGVSLRVNFGAR